MTGWDNIGIRMGHNRIGHDRGTDGTWEYGLGMTGWDVIGIQIGHGNTDGA